VWGQHADEKSSQIAYEIDTLDGIVEWWLLQQRIVQQKTLVEKALDELVAKGFVLKRTGKDGRPYYQIARRGLKIVDV
jgi:predicted transcriptional regulator